MKVLVLGDGLLAQEIIKLTGWDYLSRKEDDFDVRTNWESLMLNFYHRMDDYDVIVNCIAHTDTYDKNKRIHWDVNYKFVVNLTDYCRDNNIKLVQISTDYVYANSEPYADAHETVPIHNNTWYSYTKLLADGYCQINSNNLIIRCGHKPKPYAYDGATVAIRGNFDYVDVIAEKVVKAIKDDKDGVINIGTEVKNMHMLAKQTRPDVNLQYDLPNPDMPEDVTMKLDED